ncbi:MAG: hypothetical protein N2254_06770 [bacterium]|nr:hypothetical protein [bacterium]
MNLLRNLNAESFKRNATFLFFLLCTLCIMYPENINDLFYYDDNPIRYMIAKSWVEGKLSEQEKKFFLAYGSSEIYIPFFYIARVLKVDYELAYNLSSILILILSLLWIFYSLPKDFKDIYIIFPFLCLFAIVCLTKGSMHWLVVSSVLLNIICSREVKPIHYIAMGISYIISPPLVVISGMLFLIFLFRGDRKKAFLFVIPFLFSIPKFIIVSEITLEEVKKTLNMAHQIGRQIVGETHSFAPPVPSVFIRPFKADYFENPLLPGVIIYLTFIRSIFTRDKFAVFVFLSFYVFIFVSILIFELWIKGYNIPDIVVSMLSFFFTSNPFRFAPMALAYLIINSENKSYDKVLGLIVVTAIVLASVQSVASKQGELPRKIPEEIKSFIRFLNEIDHKRILVEGDVHFIENGKLVHPLYNSHIISYIVAEVNNKEFYGGVFPWQLYKYNFFFGKFNSKPLQESDILDFIIKNRIEAVICWSDQCTDFFSKDKIFHFGKFKFINLK